MPSKPRCQVSRRAGRRDQPLHKRSTSPSLRPRADSRGRLFQGLGYADIKSHVKRSFLRGNSAQVCEARPLAELFVVQTCTARRARCQGVRRGRLHAVRRSRSKSWHTLEAMRRGNGFGSWRAFGATVSRRSLRRQKVGGEGWSARSPALSRDSRALEWMDGNQISAPFHYKSISYLIGLTSKWKS